MSEVAHQIHNPPERPATNLKVRAAIQEIEDQLQAQDPSTTLRQHQVPLDHYFGGGVYVRRCILPVGFILTGAIHKEDTVNIITRGHVRVLTETEGALELLRFQSGANVKATFA